MKKELCLVVSVLAVLLVLLLGEPCYSGGCPPPERCADFDADIVSGSFTTSGTGGAYYYYDLDTNMQEVATCTLTNWDVDAEGGCSLDGGVTWTRYKDTSGWQLVDSCVTINPYVDMKLYVDKYYNDNEVSYRLEVFAFEQIDVDYFFDTGWCYQNRPTPSP